jgi:hypothetical protein
MKIFDEKSDCGSFPPSTKTDKTLAKRWQNVGKTLAKRWQNVDKTLTKL